MTTSHHQLFQVHGQQRAALLDLVNRTRELAAGFGNGDEDADKELEGLATTLATDRFRVMVFGQFKAGKSTLVNAMLGDGVLPARGTPCTALLTVVRWGEQPEVLLHPRPAGDRPAPKPKKATIEEFHRWSTIQKERAKEREKTGRKLEEKDDNPYAYVELHWPLDVLRNQVEIIDSPGLNEHPDREKVTLEFLAETDALIVTMSAVNPFGMTEQRYLDQVVAKYGHRDLFFAINRINQVTDVEEVIERDLEMAAPYTTDVKRRVFHINAYGSLQARTGQGGPPDAATGVPDLERALADFLAHDRGRAKIGRAGRTLQQSISDLRPRLSARRQMLDRDADELRAAYEDQKARFERLGNDRKDMLQLFTNWINDTERDVRDLVRAFYRDVAGKVTGWVDEIDREQHLTLNPFKAKQQAEAVIEEISVGLSERMTIAAGEWQETTLQPELIRRAEAFGASLGPKAQEYLSAVSHIRGELAGGAELDVPLDEPSALSKVVGTLAGLLTAGSAIGGARLGAKASLWTLAGGALTSMFAIYVLGMTNPYLIAALVFGSGILQTCSLLEGQEKKIVKKVAEKFAEALQANAADNSGEFGAHIRAALEKERDKMGQRLAKEAAAIEADVKATLAHHKDGKGAVDKERARLDETEQALNEVERKLLAMTKDLAA